MTSYASPAKKLEMDNGTAVDAKALREGKSVVLQVFEWLGELAVFSFQVLRSAVTPPYEGRELLRQMDEVGAKSLSLAAVAGAAIGIVLSIQTRASLIRFGAKSMLPLVIVMSIVRETGPIITALIVCGRVAAGMGAEIGSMAVTEQIEAMEVSAVDVFKMLAATRILACMLMLPLLTIVADACGILMGWVANALAEPISLMLFLNQGFSSVTFADILPATLKTSIFGLIIGLVGCFQGMRTRGGTEGVGRSATGAVVIASLLIILSDVVLVQIIVSIYG